jgi:hypothetical protein
LTPRLYVSAKADRLKQAKQEAEREIKAYKAQREEQYQKRIADVSYFRNMSLYTLYRRLPPAMQISKRQLNV